MQSKGERGKRNKPEVVDVCRNNLVECIKCDKPCIEGYEVGNLVTSNFIERSKGFLAERFIKPPVLIHFEFKCELEIKYIAVLCKVGAQKTTGIELLSQSRPNHGQYESIGSGVLQDVKNGFVFHRFSESVADKFGDQYFFRTFKSNRHLSRVNEITLKIFRTSGTSVPALGKVEIWAIPYKPVLTIKPQCPRFDDQTSSKESTLLISKTEPNRNLKSLTSRTLDHQGSVSGSRNVTIPEDFIDPITCEVMSQPVILPSGKIIDNTTLESHQKAELNWGRGPCDPFTGIPFTSCKKPVAATDLKARIDKYLSVNCNNVELHKIPRTVGRSFSELSSKGNCTKAIVSKLIDLPRINPTGTCGTGLVFPSATRSCESTVTTKRKRDEEDSDSSFTDNPEKVDTSSSSKLRYRPNDISNSKVHQKQTNSIKFHSFQERLDHSLELALKSTLSKLPKLTADESDQKYTVVCYVCKSCDNLFSIACNHFICRNCLISAKQKETMVCLLCNISYRSCDVQKVHPSKT